jgi:hypothetical protein
MIRKGCCLASDYASSVASPSMRRGPEIAAVAEMTPSDAVHCRLQDYKTGLCYQSNLP